MGEKRGNELLRQSELNLPARNAGRILSPSPGFSCLVAGVSRYLAHDFFSLMAEHVQSEK